MTAEKRIAIVGCGIAGLASAILLAKQGWQITLYERFPKPEPVGAGILLQPSGLLALKKLGLLENLEQVSDQVTGLVGDEVKGGRIMDVNYAQLNANEVEHRYGLGVHRGNLFNLLLKEASSVGCEICGGSSITLIDKQREQYRLLDEQGNCLGEFPVVIIANGTQSKLRECMPIKQTFKPYPWGALWSILPDPDHAFTEVLQQRYASAKIMIGMLPTGINPVTKEHCVSFFWSLANKDYKAWQQQNFNQWKEQVLAYWPELEQPLCSLTEHDQLAFARYGRVSMQAYHHQGLLCIGDAAHGMSPQLGQGTNLALIDAICLADCIARHESVEQAFGMYTKLRKSHIRFYDYASWLLTPLFQSHQGLIPWLRNQTFPLLNRFSYTQSQSLKTIAGFKTGLFFDKKIFL